ncbi:uncharacterized protein LOC143297695 [Babylonia areolata]|uniref:uncharacterized protein LOC143297695 n=1 Tax=Babylonia areolata TaxID=304850 RepID=UPI003FD1FFB5
MSAMQHYLSMPLTDASTPLPPTAAVLELADHVLKNNVFTVEGQLYRQSLGTAMGTPMAPSAANLFMGRLEERTLQDSPVKFPSQYWNRFIDDIFLLCTDSEEKLQQFLHFINTVHPTIKFTASTSETSLPFLDILIKLQGGFLSTDFFSKPTDAHAYLPATSCHPKHVIRNIPQGEFLRLQRLCSDDDCFRERARTMEAWFTRRGHHPRQVREAKDKARLIPRREALRYKTKNSLDRTPFVVSHHLLNSPSLPPYPLASVAG